jgi:hypothetical protein
MKQSSKATSGDNLAQWPDAKLLEALLELANVRDDAGAFRFLQRYPNFLSIHPGWLRELGEFAPGFSEEKRGPVTPVTESRVYHATQLSKLVRKMTPAPSAAGAEHDVKLLSKCVQEIWRGLPEGAGQLLVFLVIDDLTDALQVAIASRQFQTDDTTARILKTLGTISASALQARLRPDWTRQGRFRYEAATPFQKALYLLWAKSSLVKVCKNPDCPAPFFVARRVQQQYCGDECAAPFRLEAKMKWWNSVGRQRREKTSSKTKGKKT